MCASHSLPAEALAVHDGGINNTEDDGGGETFDSSSLLSVCFHCGWPSNGHVLFSVLCTLCTVEPPRGQSLCKWDSDGP